MEHFAFCVTFGNGCTFWVSSLQSALDLARDWQEFGSSAVVGSR